MANINSKKWFTDNDYTWYEKLGIKILNAGGNMPKHVGFITDGNRRSRKQYNISQREMHLRGFILMTKFMKLCRDFKIEEISYFSFSIENFKRSLDMNQSIFDVGTELFNCVPIEKEKFDEMGVCLRVIGNISLLPLDFQQSIKDAVKATEHNKQLIVNIVLSYTSHDEITHAIGTILKQDGELKDEDINEKLLEQNLYISKPLDMIVRTSGETRLSDFLMWQQKNCVIHFNKALWPQLTYTDFFNYLLLYQRRQHKFQNH
ncbi:dehydrodolichyl diphosphate synthase complex subunit Dhdds-like [Teleopsis dalmanni]|uniref:dehydrodolichyl diphosphate synthase complex subunit Dhdds-like n=1 Tax=Teleopsis dalmanni TaxID=139649 RepID=UPI0018CDBD48|nr:dehydrodolichyl diphosphate synthase complex subunit Dhdds-like [Teleopsis dalmanni]